MYSVQLSNLSRSDGSAILAIDDTVIQAAVYGPAEIKISKELYDKAVIDISFKPKVGQSDSTERLMEYFIRSAIESTVLTTLQPRTSINIIIQEIQDAGNMLACSVNAAYLALLDAGIVMNGIVGAVCIGVFENKMLPFPSHKETKDAKCIVTICIKNPGENIVGIKTSTFLSAEDLKKCIEIAKKNCRRFIQFL